ncbi:glycosyltransferase family 4 protein [Microbulbifer sp. DLAB2-AF]|uniref:glycosyltransferase family 4 protein n=1 Tax=Microbulbifer sp. DLAB2-AF TaxID=3243395 RepID=UPI0040397EBC
MSEDGCSLTFSRKSNSNELRSMGELKAFLNSEPQNDHILVVAKDKASFVCISNFLFAKGYIFSGWVEQRAEFRLSVNVYPEISEMVWDKGQRVEEKIKLLERKIYSEKLLREKVSTELMQVKNSRRFRLATYISFLYQYALRPKKIYHMLRAKSLPVLMARKKKKFSDFIEKINIQIGCLGSTKEKLNYIEKLSEEVRSLGDLFWSMKGDSSEIVSYVGWVLWRSNQDDLHLASVVRAKLTHLGKMYDLHDFNEEVDKALNRESSISAKKIIDEIQHYEKGFFLPVKSNVTAYSQKRKVLYLLHNSLPYNSGGYATRTHGLLSSINAMNTFQVLGVSRPGFPSDSKKYISERLPKNIPSEDRIDNVSYLRCDQTIRRSALTLSEYKDAYSKDVEKYCIEKNICIVHAASNFPNAYAAIQTARKLGIKSVYEVRGLWEITRSSRQSGWEKSDQYKYMAKMEAEACINADAVITITEALKGVMVSRGVPEEKITVIPNCVHTDRFKPLKRDQALADKLGISSSDVVVGYVGSTVNYEGLDDLLTALCMLKNKGVKNFHALIVGDGAILQDLINAVEKLKIKDLVTITGRIPHHEVQRYYSLIDITPFPRKPFEVCEKVSPLKPFEAMASGKAIVVSSCEALTEIIKDDSTGLVFKKGDVDDLSSKLETLIVDKEYRNVLGENARAWVRANRDWKNGSFALSALYDRILESG